MSVPEINPAEYREKIARAVIEAIMVNSIVEASDGQRVAAILSAEVIDVLRLQIAVLAAGSGACSSPTKIRQFCDQLARKLQRNIAEAQRIDTPFQNMTMGDPS